MPITIVRDDITRMDVDAVVNAANTTLLGGGGVDGAIHRAAGPMLLKECMTLGGCKMGQAKATKGYDMPCKYIIHTVGPVWNGGGFGEEQLLSSCYKNSLELAEQLGCKSVAFPLISAGAYGYPIADAADVALRSINEYLCDSDMRVTLVVFGLRTQLMDEAEIEEIRRYISESTAPPTGGLRRRRILPTAQPEPQPTEQAQDGKSFSQAVIKRMTELEIADSELCRRANISGSLFAKIREGGGYQLKKSEALGIAAALSDDTDSLAELLSLAGYSFSSSERADLIVKYLFDKHRTDIADIERTLFSLDAGLPGEV